MTVFTVSGTSQPLLLPVASDRLVSFFFSNATTCSYELFVVSLLVVAIV